MTEYHKIQSLFLRDEATKHKRFLMGQYSLPEFEYLADLEWIFEEKVDGTNIRIAYDGEKVIFGGRTDNAQTPTFLLQKLQGLFTLESLRQTFVQPEPDRPVVMYGEGYGAKIQKGGGDYIQDGCGFILFDVRIGHMWLKRDSLTDIAANLGIPRCPEVETGSLHKAIQMCQDGFESKLRKSAPEGLVMRPKVDLFTRRGDRVITKLKLKDFN